MFTVALLGGESTGKSTLAQALTDHLNTHTPLRALRVPELLRDWCATHGRAPLAHEQAERAAAQSRAIAAARQRADIDVVVADTTALVVAAYSELYFGDASHHASALAEQAGCELNLLMGLDLPWVPDGLFRDGPALRDATDALLRRELDRAALPYQTIYGQGEARLAQALRALGSRLGMDLVDTGEVLRAGRGRWTCESCSDPECEHRLFRDLLARRG